MGMRAPAPPGAACGNRAGEPGAAGTDISLFEVRQSSLCSGGLMPMTPHAPTEATEIHQCGEIGSHLVLYGSKRPAPRDQKKIEAPKKCREKGSHLALHGCECAPQRD